MAKDQTLKKFVEARQKYRAGVTGKTWKLYAKVVTPELADPKSLVELLKKAQSPQEVAVHQQAVDFMMADVRAQDMRKMGHMEFIANYESAVPFQDRYDKSRVDRHASGRF